MTTQNLTVNATSANDGYGATAIGLQDNATVMDSGLVSGSWQCWIWARFQTSAAIAQNSNVTTANFQMKATATDSSTTWAAEIVVEKIANAPAVSTSFSNLSSRTFTTAKTTISNDATTANTFKTWDISGAIQELVNTYGIASGDWILVAVRYATSTTSRRFYQSDNGSGDAAKLDLTYTSPPIQITASAAAVFTTGPSDITNTRELTTTAAGVWVGGPAAIVNTRELTVTAAASFGTGGPERQLVRLTGWLGSGGGSFTLQFIGFDVGPTSWDGVDPNDLKTNFEAACASSGILTGAVTVSVLSAVEPVALEVVFAHSQAPIDLSPLTVASYSGPSSPEINILRNGSYITMGNLRSVDTTAAGSFTTGTPTLVDVGVQLTAQADGAFVTGSALLSILIPLDTTAAGVFTSTVTASVKRPVDTSAAGSFTTSTPQLGTIVSVTFNGAAGSFTTSSPTYVIYCRPFVRAAGIFYATAHPDYVKPANTSAAGAFTTGPAAADIVRRATVTAPGSFSGGTPTASVYRPFTTSAAATFTATATAGIPVRLTIQTAGVFVAGSAVASTLRPVTALAAAVFTTSSPRNIVPMTTTANGVFTAAAIASFKNRAFTATAAGSFVTGSALAGTVRRVTSTNALITATAGGAGIVTSHHTTAGITFTTSAHESFKRQITAAATGTFATNTPTAKFVLRPTVAAAGSFTSSIADAVVHKMLTGSAAGIFISTADYVVTRQISVQSSLDVLTAGRLSLNRSITTTADGVFSASGTMLNTRKLTTTAAGIFNSVVGIDVYRPLSVVAGAYFGTKHVAPYVDPGILKDVWTMPPRDFVWVMPESDN